MPDPRLTVVVLTYNRKHELQTVLARLRGLPEQPAVVVVDNHSTDGTAGLLAALQRADPTRLRAVRTPANLGAAGRNHGVAAVRTPYVAFCDDDTWWAPGALARAADVLDAHPRVAAVNARVLVGPENHTDPTCDRMAASPLPASGLPGPPLVGFMAGAVVMRTAAFRAVGGYERRFFLGAEETLISLDLLAAGWAMVYRPDVVTHHHPSALRDASQRRWMTLRNKLWVAWLRLPRRAALAETRLLLREAAAHGVRARVLAQALAGLPWVVRARRPLPPEVVQPWLWVHRGGTPAAPRHEASVFPQQR